MVGVSYGQKVNETDTVMSWEGQGSMMVKWVKVVMGEGWGVYTTNTPNVETNNWVRNDYHTTTKVKFHLLEMNGLHFTFLKPKHIRKIQWQHLSTYLYGHGFPKWGKKTNIEGWGKCLQDI